MLHCFLTILNVCHNEQKSAKGIRQYVKTRYFETQKHSTLLNQFFPGFFVTNTVTYLHTTGEGQNLQIQHVYKSLTHIKNICQSALYSDVETNPGPSFYIDPTITIRAPYSQGSVSIFGETAGQQCLGMCLCALIYNKRRPICLPEDLIQVMDVGNELYLSLSRSAGETFLMFSELPSELTVFDTDYVLQYSESYSGIVFGDCSLDGYPYCVPFHRAFELLLAENYSSFILTINSNSVCVYRTYDRKYKIFDSHSRDIYGRSDPQGTCVLLEAATIDDVVLHFQSLYIENGQFEIKGVNIEQVDASDINLPDNFQNSDFKEVEYANQHNFADNIGTSDVPFNVFSDTESANFSCLCLQCCAVSLYSICYSTIKSCKYWNETTLTEIVYFGTILYNNTGIRTCTDLPEKVEICGAEVHLTLHRNYQGVVNDNLESQLNIESLICHRNESSCFLLWLENYCISCIFHGNLRETLCSVLAYDIADSSPVVHFYKNANDKQILIKTISKLAHDKIRGQGVNYEIQFLSCSSEVPDIERKRIMRKHTQHYHYDNMTPAQKQQKLENRQMKYKSMAGQGSQKTKENTIDMYIKKFKKQIKAGPFYICCVCNRTLYRKSVFMLKKSKYNRQDCFMIQFSFDGKAYICQTCDSKLVKGQKPCQAIVNNLFVDETPAELAVLEKLEQILIAQRIVFEKILIMPKGQQRKIKGAICNVPVECNQTCSVLPRPPDRSGIILLKLKRKLQFRGHVYFQAVRPQLVLCALNWLVENNPLYENIQIQCANISSDLTNLNCSVSNSENAHNSLQQQTIHYNSKQM